MSHRSLLDTSLRRFASATLLMLAAVPTMRAVEDNTPPTPATVGTNFDYNCNDKHTICAREPGGPLPP